MKKKAQLQRELDRETDPEKVRSLLGELREVADEAAVAQILERNRLVLERHADDEAERRASKKRAAVAEVARMAALSDTLANCITQCKRELERFERQKSQIDTVVRGLSAKLPLLILVLLVLATPCLAQTETPTPTFTPTPTTTPPTPAGRYRRSSDLSSDAQFYTAALVMSSTQPVALIAAPPTGRRLLIGMTCASTEGATEVNLGVDRFDFATAGSMCHQRPLDNLLPVAAGLGVNVEQTNAVSSFVSAVFTTGAAQ